MLTSRGEVPGSKRKAGIPDSPLILLPKQWTIRPCKTSPPPALPATAGSAGLLGGFAGLDPRRRAILLGGAIAVIGLAILLRPHPHPAGPVAGSDPATLATLITLPAMPSGAQWRLTPLSPDADPQGSVQGALEAGGGLHLRPGRCVEDHGAEAFFKPPFKTGTLQRLDASHLRLTLTSS